MLVLKLKYQNKDEDTLDSTVEQHEDWEMSNKVQYFPVASWHSCLKPKRHKYDMC